MRIWEYGVFHPHKYICNIHYFRITLINGVSMVIEVALMQHMRAAGG
jgi:hypothetical protein